MKDVLFTIFVALMTPIYFIITFSKFIVKGAIYLTKPFVDLINEIIETMTEFWKKILKIKEDK